MPGLKLCGPRTTLGSLEVAAVAAGTLVLRAVLLNFTLALTLRGPRGVDLGLRLWRANAIGATLSVLLLWSAIRGRFVDKRRDLGVCIVKLFETAACGWEACWMMYTLWGGGVQGNRAAQLHAAFSLAICTLSVAMSATFAVGAITISPSRWRAEDYERGVKRVFCCIARSGTGPEGGNDAVFRTLGLFAADFFGDVDLTVTDLFAGVMLVKREQKARLAARRRKAAVLPPKRLRAAAAPLADALSEASALIPYASAVYGSFMFGFSHGNRALAALVARAARRGGARPNAVRADETWSDFGAPVVEHVQRCSSVLAILLSVEQANEKVPGTMGPLVFATFHNEPGSTAPFAVFIDARRKMLVIAMRGTSSLEGALTDLLAVGQNESESGGEAAAAKSSTSSSSRMKRSPSRGGSLSNCTLGEYDLTAAGKEFCFEGEGEVAHHGFATIAVATIRELRALGVIECVLFGRGGRPDVAAAVARARVHCGIDASDGVALAPNHGWGVRVVGHSMGAGVAALVALLLRSGSPELSAAGVDVRCVAIACPLGTVSPRLAAKMRPYVTAVVLGDDLVPRASVSGLERTRDRLLSMVAQCECSPALVAAGAALGLLFGGAYALGERIDRRLFRCIDCAALPRDVLRAMIVDGATPTDGCGLLADFVAPQHQRAKRLHHTRMATPGRVLHLELLTPARVGCGSLCSIATSSAFAFATHSSGRVRCMVRPPKYAARWIVENTPQADALQEMLLTRYMLDDHFIFKIGYAVESARRRRGGGRGGGGGR